MKRTLQAALASFCIVLAREVAWRTARELFKPRPMPKVKPRKKRRHGV